MLFSSKKTNIFLLLLLMALCQLPFLLSLFDCQCVTKTFQYKFTLRVICEDIPWCIFVLPCLLRNAVTAGNGWLEDGGGEITMFTVSTNKKPG